MSNAAERAAQRAAWVRERKQRATRHRQGHDSGAQHGRGPERNTHHDAEAHTSRDRDLHELCSCRGQQLVSAKQTGIVDCVAWRAARAPVALPARAHPTESSRALHPAATAVHAFLLPWPAAHTWRMPRRAWRKRARPTGTARCRARRGPPRALRPAAPR